MSKLKVYRIVGVLSQILFPHYGSCGRCGRTWNICKGHSTQYTSSCGMFPLCESCWVELTIEDRLPYYRKLFDRWERNETIWNSIESAVRADK